MKLIDVILCVSSALLGLVCGLVIDSSKHVPPVNDGWESNRVLVCEVPGSPGHALPVDAIKFNGKYFEVKVGDKNFTYVPSQFETCFTMMQPTRQATAPTELPPGTLNL